VRITDPATWEKAKDVISDALKLPPAERAAFVRERCPDPVLRDEIDAMLRAYDEDPDFLEQAATGAPLRDDRDELRDLKPGVQVGPYVILGRLGRGGMGQVFLGNDPRLDRRVALKCLISSPLEADERRHRILREARAAAGINHPNVATVHEFVEHAGRAFIVMEYVEGESLAARLKRERLPIDVVVAVGRQLVAALAAAHASGVIHRDLKPANIQLLPDGTVKVLDFGVAKAMAIASSSSATTRRHTSTDPEGRYIQAGTPGYMSPEQMLGRDVDDRSDIFSLGVVLYEMTTGRRPFTKSDPLDLVVTMAKRLPRVDAGDTRVPHALADVIAKALEVDPADRFQSAVEMEHALAALDGAKPAPGAGAWWRRPIAAALVAATALILVAALLLRRGAPGEGALAPTHRVVAVLPLENLSGDPAKQYLGAGVAETLMMALSKVSTLTVISRSEVQEAVGRTREPRKVAEDLHASFLVDGSVQQAGDRLRVTLRLVQPDGRVKWSEGYEDAAASVFVMHRAMAEDIVRQLQGATGTERPDFTLPPTSNVDALTAYWQGSSILERAVSPDDFEDALSLFRKAAELDDKFALAYAGEADVYWRQYQLTHDQALPRKALDAGLTAMRLDANQPAVRVALANIYQGMGQYDAASDELRRALELQPSSDDVHRTLGVVLAAQGKPDDAARELNEAIRIRPNHWINQYELGRFYWRIRRLNNAAVALQRALELRPNDSRLVGTLGAVYATMGDDARALEKFEQANRLAPSSVGFANIGTVYYRLGRFDDAVKAWREAIRLNPKYELAHYNLADGYARVGRTADANREMRIARDLWLAALRVNERDARTMARIAVCEAKLDMRTLADSHAAQAVALAPQDPEVQYKRAVVDALAGRRADAFNALKRAVEIGFSRREAREDYDLRALKGLPEFVALVGRPDEGGYR
jgi:eukaryotic-like serine/threonine-protein kinase